MRTMPQGGRRCTCTTATTASEGRLSMRQILGPKEEKSPELPLHAQRLNEAEAEEAEAEAPGAAQAEVEEGQCEGEFSSASSLTWAEAPEISEDEAEAVTEAEEKTSRGRRSRGSRR